MRIAVGNMGNLHYALGDFDRAGNYLEKVLIRASGHDFGPDARAALKVSHACGSLRAVSTNVETL